MHARRCRLSRVSMALLGSLAAPASHAAQPVAIYAHITRPDQLDAFKGWPAGRSAMRA